MSLEYDRKLILYAKKLRKNMTKYEAILWYHFLRNHQFRFQRQKVIDRFIVDFYCSKVKLYIEIDGSQHYDEQGLAYDLERKARLSKLGLKELRFSNNDIRTNLRGVCYTIDQAISALLKKESSEYD